jgi:hypothetical protein
VQPVGLPPYGLRPNAPGDPSTPHFDGSHIQSSSFLNLEFKFLLMHESNFHVTGFSYGSNTRDAVRRVSRSRADFDVAATTASSWILTATASKWILVATTSNQASKPEFQHSSPTFGSLAGGHAPPWGMPPWMTPTLQPQRPSYSSLTVRHICASVQLLHS